LLSSARSTIFQRGLPLAFAICALIAVVLAFAAPHAAAHAQLVKSAPPADALLAVPPRQIDLFMSERVATVEGSPAVKVLDENGRAVTTGPATVDPSSQTHITASVDGISTGTFTVVWTATSADDGHTLTGTFAFRVGGTDRAPGAATTEGERPRPWAVATRWITFLGAGVAAAVFLFRSLGLFSADPRSRGERRRMLLAAGAAVIALIATALEPVLQGRFPAAGVSKASVGDAISALPSAWWLRAPGLAVAASLALGLMRMPGRRQPPRWLGFVGAAAALIAILGLALTTHTAARESWRPAAIASIVAHEWGGALWAGGLICLAVSLPGRTDDGWDDGAIRRFSKFAMVMVAVLGIAGLVNAGLIFPTVNSVWKSDFGRVLIVKTAVLLGALALAAWHWLTIRRGVTRLGQALRATIRFETGLVAAVVLGGTILALVAPPVKAPLPAAARSMSVAGAS
jgi:copper transport protein